MKKIIIVNNNMQIGGVQKSLYNLLWALEGRVDVTLALFSRSGVYADRLPPSVKVVGCESLFRYLGVSQGTCQGADKLKRGALAAVCKLFGRGAVMRLILRSQAVLPESYDCAVAFLHNGNIKNFYGGVQEFVLRKVNARKKVAFLHCDYGSCGADYPYNNRLLAEFDWIAACSDGCRDAFARIMPELAGKCVTVRNCHRMEEIRDFAQAETVRYAPPQVHVVMVSRLAHEKGIERAIEAAACAERSGIPVCLHIVGGGPMEVFLRKRAKEQGIGDKVCFHGEQANPYPYMKAADLFLMTSFHEAAPMVIEEARALAVPVLTVRTTSSEEMVTAKDCGWVCENEQTALNAALIEALSDREGLAEKKRALQSRIMDNAEAKRQFLQLIEG